MRLVPIVLAFLFVTGSFGDDALARKCTKAEAVFAEREAGSLDTWDQVYRSYKQFAHCDDGAIGEGYSDSVTRLLADDWKSFKRLMVLAEGNTKFRRFVVRHIDETVPGDRLVKIAQKARSECPAGGRSLCSSIAKAAGK